MSYRICVCREIPGRSFRVPYRLFGFGSRADLFDVKYQSLEVFAFGMIDVDRMVGGLGQLVQDADLASGDGRGREDRGAEQLLADRLRTGESEEEPSAFDLRQRPGIEPLVALHGIAQHFVVLGEGRRVEDDHVVPVADVL